MELGAAAMVGGVASRLAGGRFADGAVTGFFSRAFNDMRHPRDGKNIFRRIWDDTKTGFAGAWGSRKAIVYGPANSLYDIAVNGPIEAKLLMAHAVYVPVALTASATWYGTSFMYYIAPAAGWGEFFIRLEHPEGPPWRERFSEILKGEW